ncbi:MAG: hypothetical protein WBW87_05630 [Candidatus Cybelea sp.]
MQNNTDWQRWGLSGTPDKMVRIPQGYFIRPFAAILRRLSRIDEGQLDFSLAPAGAACAGTFTTVIRNDYSRVVLFLSALYRASWSHSGAAEMD